MNKKSIMAVAVVAALSTGLVTSALSPVFAADTEAKATETKAEQKVAEQDLIKVSEDALATLRNVHGARLAIFNGSPDKAQTYTDAAASRVAASMKDVDQYALDVKKPVKDDEEYVPFNASLAVAETLVPDEAKMKTIAKANEHLHKGETKKAIEVLKLGQIDVALTADLIPLKLAKAHIDDATKLIGEHKYYEANLALKSVEDAVLIETYAIDQVPQLKGKS